MNNSNKTPNKNEPECQTQQMTSMILPSRDITSDSSNKPKLHWVGMTPLEWMESLATTTEICESHRLHRPMTPIRIGGEYLANHNAFQAVQGRNTTVDTMLSGNRAENITVAMDTTSRISSIPDGVGSSNLPFQSSTYHHHPQNHLPQPHPSQVPKYWDLACFKAAGPISLRIRHIAISVESQPNFGKHLQRSYEATRDHCLWTIAVLRSKRGSEPSALDMGNLCHAVLQKLEALLELSRKLTTQEQAQFLSGEHSAADVAIGGLASPGLATHPCTSGKKHDLSKYMTQWLRENWTNPYPDEIAIQQMSSECGSTTTVVSNWLINARTRKWRPSIIKAYEMERPADLLLEDSINIFCGKPVRKLDPILPMVSPARGHGSKSIGHSPPSSGPGSATKRARKV
jgi:hypothetical protein